jgi:hypothetical protein
VSRFLNVKAVVTEPGKAPNFDGCLCVVNFWQSSKVIAYKNQARLSSCFQEFWMTRFNDLLGVFSKEVCTRSGFRIFAFNSVSTSQISLNYRVVRLNNTTSSSKPHLGTCNQEQVTVLGDLSRMHPESVWAAVLRAAGLYKAKRCSMKTTPHCYAKLCKLSTPVQAAMPVLSQIVAYTSIAWPGIPPLVLRVGGRRGIPSLFESTVYQRYQCDPAALLGEASLRASLRQLRRPIRGRVEQVQHNVLSFIYVGLGVRNLSTVIP